MNYWFWMWITNSMALVGACVSWLILARAARAQRENDQRYIDDLHFRIEALRDQLESTQGSK